MIERVLYRRWMEKISRNCQMKSNLSKVAKKLVSHQIPQLFVLFVGAISGYGSAREKKKRKRRQRRRTLGIFKFTYYFAVVQ